MNSIKPTGNETIDANFQKLVSDIVVATLAASAAASAAALSLDESKNAIETAQRSDVASAKATTAAVTATLAAVSASHLGGNWNAPSLVWEGFSQTVDIASYGNGIYMVATSTIDGTPSSQKLVVISPYANGTSSDISSGIVKAIDGTFVSNIYKIAG